MKEPIGRTSRPSVRRHLPTGLIVRAPVAPAQLAEETLRATEQGLDFACALSLAMAVFIILNTFLMNVSERRRQLAIMRAVGATRAQIRVLLLTEALMLGVVGTGLGLVAGIAGADMLTRVMIQPLNAPMIRGEIGGWTLVLAGCLGPAIALLAAYLPSRQAAQINASEGVDLVLANDRERFPRVWSLAGLALYVSSAGLLAAIVREWVSPALAIPAGLVMLLAFIVMIPVVLGPLARFAALVLRPFSGVEGFLAQRQVLRRRTRTTLTVGVLVVAISNGIGLGNTIVNHVQDIRHWYQHMMAADFFLMPLGEQSREATGGVGHDRLDEVLRQVPGITEVNTLRYVNANADGSPVMLVARSMSPQKPLPMETAAADPDSVRRGMFDGEVVIGMVLAKRLALSVGQELILTAGSHSHRLRIAAVTDDWTAGGLTVYMERRRPSGCSTLRGRTCIS